ncbi:MAG: hypothetical protein QOC97_688, partial [Chloroflexota bacterium]|nr:hypothetical protein [Chloroflexota bacterium]
MNEDLDPAGERSPADPDPTTRMGTPTTPLAPASREDATPATFEHEPAWATVAPASAVVSTATPVRRSRARWTITIAIIALVIAASAAVALLITGRSSNATVLGYVPEGATMYGEVRLDLPGDQRLAVGAFLSKFPGFADQSSLETKLNEVLDDLVKGATQQTQTYTTDIKPWFGGELAFAVGPLPPPASVSSGDTSAMSAVRMLALVSVKDPGAAQAWLDAAVAKSGSKTTSETYNGATLSVLEAVGGVQPAYALIDGKVAAIGDIASVKGAVDTKGAGAFSKEDGPKAALASSTGDHVGFMYVALRPLMDWSSALSKLQPTQPGSTPLTVGDSLLKAVPDWGAFALRFQSSAIVLEASTPSAATPLGPTENRVSSLVEHIPSNAIVASITNDYGKTIKQALDLYRAEPSLKSIFDQIDTALGLVGGTDAAIGWAGDTAIVVTVPDATPEAGLIVAPTDKAAAQHLFTSLRSFIEIGGAQQGITVRDETYNGTTITTVDVGDIAKLSQVTGPEAAILPSGHIEIAYAITDNVVVLGSGPGFVKHVLDTTVDTSLASNARYKTLADQAGAGTGTRFVDVAAIRALAEKFAADAKVDPAALARYKSDVKPFLLPFDVLFASGTTGSGGSPSSI